MKLFSFLFREKRKTDNLCAICGKQLKTGEVYRGKNNAKCCETCYLKANSQNKAASVPEQHSPAQASRKEPVQPSKAVNPTLFRTLWFSALRLPDTEQEVPVPFADSHTASIKQIADRFFNDPRQALMVPTGNEEQDRYQAMEWLIQFLFSVTEYTGSRMFDGYDQLISMLKCTPNTLKLLLRTYESPCYDGGSGGTNTEMTWMTLERLETVPSDILLQANSGEAGVQELPVRNLYRGKLPGEDFKCVFKCRSNYDKEKLLIDRNKGVFLFNPFGLEGVYCFRIYVETW